MRKQHPPTQTTPAQLGDEASPSTPAPEARPGDSGNRRGTGPAGDAPPSNTASHSYLDEFMFQPLRWGVDSLYLSYQGNLNNNVEDRLGALKKAAQSAEAHEQLHAQYPTQGHLFEVKDKGAPLFPYVLEDNAYRIQLSHPGRKAPMAYVKLSSGLLNHLGAAKAEQELRTILEEMGELKDGAHVSRIDLHLDFVSNVAMDRWGREAWVTRAANINHYSENNTFTGWMIGAGGVISFRLYNKTQELKKSGKAYLMELWANAGWDGVSDVWRAEFQYRRELLGQLGVVKLDSVLRHLNGLWSYATTDWLRLTEPDPQDSNRGRWPIHPLWLAISSIDWDTPGGPLLKRFSNERAPDNDWPGRVGFAALTTLMASRGVLDAKEGNGLLLEAIHNYTASKALYEGVHPAQYLIEKVQAKARKFNTLCNLHEIPDEDRIREELDEQARDYRKASKGG